MKVEVFPPHGFVRYLGSIGTELDIVNAARVSFHKESESFGKDEERLMNFLMKNRHGTPFEQGFMARFHIRLPIFVMREWVRHRIGYSINEESGRYVEMRPDFYIPETKNVRKQEGKPGAYTFTGADEGLALYAQGEIKMASERAFDVYRRLLEQGIAKEQARLVLPLNLYTEMRWTCNARSMMNFLGLRAAPDAMFEIRQYAYALEDIFATYAPAVHKLWEENGRIAP